MLKTLALPALCLVFLAPTAFAQLTKPTLKSADAVADDSVKLTWENVPNATGYVVYWSKTQNFTVAQALASKSVQNLTYTVQSLDKNAAYYFAVAAVANGQPASELSDEKLATPGSQQAPAPNNPQQPQNPGQDKDTPPAPPTSNIGQSPDVKPQNPNTSFTLLDKPATYRVLGVSAAGPSGTITYDQTGIDALVQGACAVQFPTDGSRTSKDLIDAALADSSTYVLINVIKLAGSASAQSVSSVNWYLYSKNKKFWSGFAGGWSIADFDGGTRLYGAKKVLLISILENATTAANGTENGVEYKLTVTRQQQTNVTDAMQLLGLTFPQLNAGGNRGTPLTYWACSSVPIVFKTSTIKVDLQYSADLKAPYSASQTFVNEPKEHWDVSFAYPVKKASALQYSSTNNTVTASQINKSDLFAVFDLYPYPVDLKNNKFTFIPGIFGGVAMNSQPLHSILAGGSVGAKFAQVYVGCLWLKQQQLKGLSTGSTGSITDVANASSYAFKPSLSVGIKISISAAAAAISGSKK